MLGGNGVDESRTEMDLVVNTKMEQLGAYKKECAVMFP